MGCHLEYDYDYLRNSTVNRVPNTIPAAPWSLRKLLGDDFFMNVTFATITSGSDMTDADLKFCTEFKQLKILYLSRKTKITGAGLKKLQKELPNLQILRFDLPD
jgi:hypothetical protein